MMVADAWAVGRTSVVSATRLSRKLSWTHKARRSGREGDAERTTQSPRQCPQQRLGVVSTSHHSNHSSSAGPLTRVKALVHGRSLLLVAAEAGARKVGLDKAGGNLSAADASGYDLLHERAGEGLDGAVGVLAEGGISRDLLLDGTVDGTANVRLAAGKGANVDNVLCLLARLAPRHSRRCPGPSSLGGTPG